MKIVLRICFVLSLVSVALAVVLGLVMIWGEVYEGPVQRLFMSAIVTFIGCLALLVVIQTIVGRGGGGAA